MALVAAGIADGGVVHRPYVIDRVTDAQRHGALGDQAGARGAPRRTRRPPRTVRDLMVGVVDERLGTRAQINGVTVAGKTGTAEVGKNLDTHAWFIAFAPAEKPRGRDGDRARERGRRRRRGRASREGRARDRAAGDEVTPATVPTVETARLLLRGWRDDDVARIADILADAQVATFLFGGPLDLEEARAAVERRRMHWATAGVGYWAVELKETGALVGWAGLQPVHHFPEFAGETEVGWMLAHEAWGRGLATEAGAASLRFGFEDLALDRVYAFHLPANGRSEHVMEKLGMVSLGTTPAIDTGEPDCVRVISHEQWLARRGAQR